MKIRLITTALGSLLCAWLVSSYLAPATVTEGWNERNADSHRLGPVSEGVASLPDGDLEMAPVNLFVLLTKEGDESIAVR